MSQMPFSTFLLGFLFLYGSSQAALTISPDRQDGLYATDTAMEFRVTSDSAATAAYTIRRDLDTAVLASGSVAISPGNPAIIPFSSAVPCGVLCDVTATGGTTARAGAIFGAERLQPLEAEPADFDAWWALQKAELAAVPMDPVLTPHSSNTYTTTWRVNLASVAGRRVYGYLSVPAGTGPFPAILSLPPFGSSAGVVQPESFIAERGGALSLAISIHNAEPDAADPAAYSPNDISTREGNYYRLAILGCLRAIDYLHSRTDYDGSHLGVCGVSQGGGLAIMAAGLDPRVKLLAQSNAALCEHAGLKYDHASGFPDYIKSSRAISGTAAHEAATIAASKYFDAVYFARRFTGPSLNIISCQDDVCPPATVLAAVNQLKGPHVVVYAPPLGHSHPNEYWEGRYDLWRRYFPAMRTPPWPWPQTTTGYAADAGPDQSITAGVAAALAGTVQQNGTVNPALPVAWRKVSGPGTVLFSQPQSRNSSAAFSADGTYWLEFSTSDDSSLASQARLHTARDRVRITVGEGGGEPPANAAPVVSAGSAQSLTLPVNTVTLTGSATDDGLPAPPGSLTYEWSLLSGPGSASIAQPAGLQTTATLSTAGTYIFQFSASDSQLSGSATVSVTLEPAAPEPPAGSSIQLTTPGADSAHQAGAPIALSAAIQAPSGEPAHIRITNPLLGWNRLNFGYDPGNIWNPPNNVTSGGNTRLDLTLKDFTGTAQWDKLWIYPQGDSANGVKIGSYFTGNAETWTTVHIPLADFPAPAAWTGISHISLPFSENAAAFDIGIARVEFTGGTTPFLWYGGSRTTNSLDGTGNPGTLPAQRVAATTAPTIASVQYFSGTVLLAAVTSPPWEAQWLEPPGGNHSLTARAVFSDGSTSTSPPVSIHVRSAWESWQHTSFTTTQLLDPDVSSPQADPDHDGLANLLEYAAGLQPLENQGLQPLAPHGDQVRLLRSTTAVDVSLLVEISTDLQGWHPGPAYGPGGHILSTPYAAESSRTSGPGVENITIAPAGEYSTAPRLLYRLMATLEN